MFHKNNKIVFKSSATDDDLMLQNELPFAKH